MACITGLVLALVYCFTVSVSGPSNELPEVQDARGQGLSGEPRTVESKVTAPIDKPRTEAVEGVENKANASKAVQEEVDKQATVTEMLLKVPYFFARNVPLMIVGYFIFLVCYHSYHSNNPTAKQAERLKRIRKVFEEFDTDHSGDIDGVEMKCAMRQLGKEVSDDNIQSLLAKLDANHDGKFEFSDFIGAMEAVDTGGKEEAVCPLACH